MQRLLLYLRLVFLYGCGPHLKYTTHEEYKEKKYWDPEKGIVKAYKATASVEWKND
jgi:hypothetical protein